MLLRGMRFLLVFAITQIVHAEPTVKYKCPSDGWIIKGTKCYKWGVSPRNFENAVLYCVKQNSRLQVIESKEENEYFREEGTMSQYWLGLRTSRDIDEGSLMCWKLDRNSLCWNQSYTNWLSQDSYGMFNYEESCAMWNSGDGKWVSSPNWQCQQTNLLFLCEQKAVCQDSYFGPKCSKQCHCLGKSCTSQDIKCKYGCQRGWTGDLCSRRKMKPKALYYCFNTKNGGKRIVFRADMMGTTFRHVHGLDVNNHAWFMCNKWQFKQSGDRLTIDIVAKKDKFEPRCGEEKIEENIFKWKFEFKEFLKTRSAYDVIFEAKCTFQSSGSLRRSANIASKEGESETTFLESSNFSVDLTVVDPYTGKDIKSAPLGTNARLVLTLRSKQSEIGVQTISPHTCNAATDDGKESIQLMDQFGCQDESSPITFENGNGTSWWSKPFEIFTFPGYDHVTITCMFIVCFKENIDQCRVENICRQRTTPESGLPNTNSSRSVGTRFSVK